jgi:hypothetical protein
VTPDWLIEERKRPASQAGEGFDDIDDDEDDE